jgi:hypothetical protein
MAKGTINRVQRLPVENICKLHLSREQCAEYIRIWKNLMQKQDKQLIKNGQ